MEKPIPRIVVTSSDKKFYTASLFLNGTAVISAGIQASSDDEDPGGSAIAVMWLKLHQMAGKNITRIEP